MNAEGLIYPITLQDGTEIPDADKLECYIYDNYVLPLVPPMHDADGREIHTAFDPNFGIKIQALSGTEFMDRIMRDTNPNTEVRLEDL